MDGYKLVFEAGSQSPLGVFALGVVFMLFGLVLAALGRVAKPPPPKPAIWFAFAFGVIWTLGVCVFVLPQWLYVRNVVKDKTYSVVSGPVEDFRPEPKEGHAPEQFRVRGVSFAYSDFEASAGYHTGEIYGGVIHKDSHVRIGYVCAPDIQRCDHLIVRLEILSPSSAPAS